MAELSGPGDEPGDTEGTAGPGGRLEDTAGPGGRVGDTAGPEGRVGEAAGVVAAAGGVVWRREAGDAVDVVLVHRPRYDDWSLPKGKLDPGESHADGALREVEEETGLRCALDDALSTSTYRDRRGRTKVVRYWLMHPTAAAGTPSAYATGEVDQAVWLPVDEAVTTASYERDRELIRTAATLVRART